MKDEIKEIRDYIACPQLGDDYYGEWGALRLDQRLKIKSLLDYITNLEQQVNGIGEERVYLFNKLCREKEYIRHYYKSRIDKAVEYIENDLKSFLFSIEYKTLLNILTGDDSDE